MNKPSASLVVATLALVVALTGSAGAAGLIDGHSIKPHSITADKLANGAVHSNALAKGAVTTKSVAHFAITKDAIDPNAVQVINNISAPAGPKGDPGATIIGQAGTPGADGRPGTPGVNSPHAWGIVHADGSLGDSANLTVRKPGAPNDTGIYCLSTGGYDHTNAIAVAQPWGSQLATPGYVGQGNACNANEFQIDVLSPSSTLVDSLFSVVIS